ncbi:hypothetical protein AAHC03_05393 [Spirometra sp. Aus1]
MPKTSALPPVSLNVLHTVICIAFCCKVFGKTDEVDATGCFQSPQNPILFDSIVLTSSANRGYVVCFLQPVRTDYYVSIRLNSIELSGDCPTLVISEYSTLITEEIPESENFPAMNIQRPSDLNPLATISCKDFGNFRGKILFTSVPGRKLMVIFRPTGGSQTLGFQMTITSYYLGTAYSCPADNFRCWNARDRCIPDSLTCDGVDNCYDGSDETNFLCTGRIGYLPLPLFVILILVGILCMIVVITSIIFCIRRDRLRRQEKSEWKDMNMGPIRSSAKKSLMTGERV